MTAALAFFTEPRDTPVTKATLAHHSRLEASAEIGVPGAKGTRRALEDNVTDWVLMYDKEIQDLERALVLAREESAFWHRIQQALPSPETP